MNILDMHCDTIYRIHEKRFQGKESSLRNDPELQINLEKMQKGNYLLQNFAAFVELEEAARRFPGQEDAPYRFALALADTFDAEMAANSDLIRPVTSWSDIRQNEQEHCISALFTLEEGGICMGDVEKLRELYRRGARMMTLTWNHENELGFPSCMQEGSSAYRAGEKRPLGLTETGIRFVEEMEALGMIVDVSHMSDDGFFDVCEHAKKPFVASHSNARALCGHKRNLTDEMLRMLGERGGVSGLNLCPDFVIAEKSADGSRTHEGRNLLEYLACHAVHMMEVGGSACVGLGTDFDGFDEPSQPRDASAIQDFAWALHKLHVSDDQIDNILFGNVLNLYRELLNG